MAKSLSVTQALTIRRHTIRPDGGWGDCVGEIDRTGVVFFWGKSGNGKTSAVMSFGKAVCSTIRSKKAFPYRFSILCGVMQCRIADDGSR